MAIQDFRVKLKVELRAEKIKVILKTSFVVCKFVCTVRFMTAMRFT